MALNGLVLPNKTSAHTGRFQPSFAVKFEPLWVLRLNFCFTRVVSYGGCNGQLSASDRPGADFSASVVPFFFFFLLNLHQVTNGASEKATVTPNWVERKVYG